MQAVLLGIMLVLSATSKAESVFNSPSFYCTSSDDEMINAVLQDMDNTGFSSELSQKGVEISRVGETCLDVYSLERAAGRRIPANAPTPECGIGLILDENSRAEQAKWILDVFGKRYQASLGVNILLCIKENATLPEQEQRQIRPFPGGTVFN